eukprot:1875648-Amphidinium_carterae.2
MPSTSCQIHLNLSLTVPVKGLCIETTAPLQQCLRPMHDPQRWHPIWCTVEVEWAYVSTPRTTRAETAGCE